MNKRFLTMMGASISTEEIYAMNAVKLAYLGDAIFELYLRHFFLATMGAKNHEIAKKTSEMARASFQSSFVRSLEEGLSDKEAAIFRRGRNSAPKSTGKNIDQVTYKYATGFEALIGYLYLTDQHERLDEIIKQSIEFKIRKQEHE